MGQHKTNPTAIKAKNGELPPKSRPMSKREMDKKLMEMIMCGTNYGKFMSAIDSNPYV